MCVEKPLSENKKRTKASKNFFISFVFRGVSGVFY